MSVCVCLSLPDQIVLSLDKTTGWQHGSLHGCALENTLDLAANAADPKGLSSL